MSDLVKLQAENQKEMLNLIAPVAKKTSDLQNFGDSDAENTFIAPTSTFLKLKYLKYHSVSQS